MFGQIAVAALAAVTSVIAALAALLAVSAIPMRRGRREVPALIPELEPAIFLFDDKELVDATGPAKKLLSRLPEPGAEWARIVHYLDERFGQVRQKLAALSETGQFEMSAKDGHLQLQAESLGGLTRLTLVDLDTEGQAVLVDGLSQRAQEQELALLRETVAASPTLVWRTDAKGEVVWANRAYLDLCTSEKEDGDLSWPLPCLFPNASQVNDGKPRRMRRADTRAKGWLWFEVSSKPTAGGLLHSATSVDSLIQAEAALREFVQTLTKTFAQLPIGLAIFDRQRLLQLFNPALVDLTRLSVDFLSARPTLFSFLDRLRETQIVPEPKDYQTWRRQMAELESAAASGRYEEIWTLPGGQTYKVSGSPHADGAVAFFFEDISAEVTLTRRFRSELGLGQSILDSLDEAICACSPTGEVLLHNAAFSELWGIAPDRALSQMSILDVIAEWRKKTLPSPVWGDFRDFVTELGERAEWFADVTHADGRALSCRFAPLTGGATLAGFSETLLAAPPPRECREATPMREPESAKSG